MSHVGTSFKQPIACAEYNGMGVIRLLEAIRKYKEPVKLYQAGTSELFGNAVESPQNELTAFHPVSPYAIAKLTAHYAVSLYRQAYGLFACNGILFNHESPRRGMDFVTRKISDGVARIKHGLLDKIQLGNIEPYRDWGYAGDYVEAMWLMLQQEKPDDYIIATGQSHRIVEFFALACKYAGLPRSWAEYMEHDPSAYRPSDVHNLIGDASKARSILGWQPKVGFEELVTMMVQSDLRKVHDNESRSSSPYRSHTPRRVVHL